MAALSRTPELLLEFIRLRQSALAAALLVLVAACAPQPTPEPDLRGEALEKLYAITADRIRAGGGLRTERNPPDVPVSVESLARNFERVAFFSEFSANGTQLRNRARPITLTRWEDPIRMGVLFGPSISDAQRRRDLNDVRALLRRFRNATPLDIRYVPDGDINFLVMVMTRDEQLAFADQILEARSFPASIAADLRASRPSLLCSANLISADDGRRVIGFASALIKAEHREVMRTSCFHEELTQALGLVNDSFSARPSIFNDDEEFALLTLHDEILLRMLYDDRLRPGMTAAEARPMLMQIAAEAAAAAGVVFR
ncbi:MAG: DUF2927 domain-containing protein [Pseudomonadota bacterium]